MSHELPSTPAQRATPRGVEAQIARIAGRQHGLVTASQLAEVGITPSARSLRARDGRLHRVHRGVYAVGHVALSREGRWRAAVFAVGDGAALSGPSAAELWGITRRRAPVSHVIVRGRHRHHAGVVVHESRSLEPRDRTRRRGIPVTSVARTLLDLGVDTDPYLLANVVHEAEYHELLRPRAVESVLARNATHHGARSLREALEVRATGSVGVRSRLELRFLRHLVAAGAPRPLVNVRFEVGSEQLEVDLRWPDHGLCVEVDGPGHARARTAREDARRDALLRAAGWRVVRVAGSEEDVRMVAALVGAGR